MRSFQRFSEAKSLSCQGVSVHNPPVIIDLDEPTAGVLILNFRPTIMEVSMLYKQLKSKGGTANFIDYLIISQR